MTISILNVPEGLAIAIPLIAAGMNRWTVVGWAVLSGLPQPIGAVVAYAFVSTLEGALAVSFGFAAIIRATRPAVIGLEKEVPDTEE